MGRGLDRVVEGTIFRECPECEARLLPGDVACSRCGFDFISGRQLRGVGPGRLRWLGLGSVVVSLSLSIVLWCGDTPEAPPAEDQSEVAACVTLLDKLTPMLVAVTEQGLQIPTCPRGDVSSLGCLGPLGIRESRLPSVEGLAFALRPIDDGFGLSCWSDLDEDGEFALYRATHLVKAVRLTGAEVR